MEKALPMGWEMKKLGEVCMINPPKPEMPNDNNITFLPMDAVGVNGDILYRQTKRYKEVKNGYTGFIENDVLFAKITPCMENGKGTIAKSLLNSTGFGSTEFHVIRAGEKILPEIIFRYLSLKNIRKLAEVNMAGSAGQKRVPQSFLNTLQIPIPPLSLQHKIVEILEEADSLRKLRKQADEKMKDLIPSLFVEMFGDPTTNPKGWEIKKLGEVLRVKSGKFLPAKSMNMEGDYPVYGGNGINGYHDLYMFDESKIVIGRVGALCGCVHLSQPRSWITDNALYVSEKVRDFDDKFMITYLTFLNLNEKANSMAQPQVSGKIIYPLRIPIPPLPLQQEFAKRVKETEAEKERQAEGRKKLDELFNSLMQKAFTGELVA